MSEMSAPVRKLSWSYDIGKRRVWLIVIRKNLELPRMKRNAKENLSKGWWERLLGRKVGSRHRRVKRMQQRKPKRSLAR